MSNDTAECGCEGHVENFSECKYPALLERVRRLEDDLAAADSARAQQAERARRAEEDAAFNKARAAERNAYAERMLSLETVLREIHTTPYYVMSLDQQMDLDRRVQRLLGLGGA